MPTNHHSSLVKVIALGTLLIGTLDISDALIFYRLRGVPLIQIPQSIASGILGRVSFNMGLRSALLGMGLHYFITVVVVTLYLLASRRLPLFRHPFLYGALYGIVVYFFMNNLVLPLSRLHPPRHLSLVPFLNGIAASIFLIGLPTALLARRFQTPEVAEQ
jgi:hypothetical protein